MSPVTILKIRYESNLYDYRSLISASRSIFATEGVRGFFKGFGATAARDAPYAGLYVLFYEQGKGVFGGILGGSGGGGGNGSRENENGKENNKEKKRESMMGVNFLSGVVAAVAATSLTNPFDAVKTRLQLMPGRYGNLARAASVMVREEGWRCLFAGLGLRVGRKAVSSALAWTGYEELIRRMEGSVVGG